MKRALFVASLLTALTHAAPSVEAAASRTRVKAAPRGAAAPASAPAKITMQAPPEKPSDLTPRILRIQAADLTRDSADAGDLKGIRLVSASGGTARVILGGAERSLRAGDVVGADVVRRVEARRIVLSRPPGAKDLGEGRVIVTFDATGRGRVHVFLAKADTPPPVPSAEGN